ncbi:hypothetical protein [Bergeyella zoohelcum]|uniref:Phospholipase D-like domain-containing protein n=1 Tax=Bergeyella zoohelcum TaxID=1015 RepID=A0A7Z9CGS0_9FLAO|nr:hypothetical protein [Bergeyella zoohelcum]VDH05874.1 Uncharacterised protein [Bergeyella zoohelcum]
MKGLKQNKFFSLKDFSEKKELPKLGESKSHSAYLNSHLERIDNLNDLVRIPQEGEIFFLHTVKAFNAFTFIPWLAKRHFIEELYASTYSISRRVIEALQELQQKGRIGEVTLLISDSMIKRNPVTIDVLEGVAKHNANFQVKYFWNHSKVCLIKAGDFHLVLEGSGNWSENAQLEQYVLANSEAVFNFRKTIFE